MAVIGHGYDDNVGAPAYRNVIINGAMQLAQRATSVTNITTAGYRTADRWSTGLSALGTWTQTVENDGPTGSGLRKSLKMLCTTADASPASGDYAVLEQGIEGQNVQHFFKGSSSALKFAVQFWVKSNVTGTYIIELRDNDNSRNICRSYTISASGVWEKKTLIFDADTTGVFDNDNNNSFGVIFWLGAGSSFTSGTLTTSWGSWSNNANRAVGQVNVGAATNNYWQITGVQIESGPIVTPFEFEDISTLTTKCERYYEGSSGVWSISGYLTVPYRTIKRATPVVTIANSIGTTTEVGGAYSGQGSIRFYNAASGDFTWTASAEL